MAENKKEKKQANKTGNKSGGRTPKSDTNAKRYSQIRRPSNAKKSSAQKKKNESDLPVRISFLGGLNEVGKNMTLYEYEDDMFIVDCGLSFPEQDMLGVDLVIPDFTYVERNADKIKGIVITHGHEDHIGALAYLLKNISIPVYGTKLTMGLVEGKLEEHGLLGKAKLNVVKAGDRIKLGKFEVELIHVNHSIPDAVALAVKCASGVIVQTGDFKIDSTPIDGDMIDLARFCQLGREGVMCLLSDSTNAERTGFTESEKKVGETFDVLFRKAGNRRLIVATFASNIHRVQQIIDTAQSLGRKVALSGRSLENVVEIGSRLGYLNIPKGILVNIDMINRYPADKMVIITTGSQGEPMSALTRMAFSDHRKVAINPNDFIIISATPIPGNEKMVGKVVNELLKLGAEVVYERMYDVHVSGHACREELKIMLGIVKPKYFIPVHGEQKHLVKHAQIAESMGIPSKNIIIADNGRVVEMNQKDIKTQGTVPAGRVFVDGYGVGDVGSIVLRDRKHLAQDGLIVVVATIDGVSGSVMSGPDIVSRGFVYVRESEDLMHEARTLVQDILDDCAYNSVKDWGAIKTKVRDEVSHLMYERTKRSPMILPVIMEI